MPTGSRRGASCALIGVVRQQAASSSVLERHWMSGIRRARFTISALTTTTRRLRMLRRPRSVTCKRRSATKLISVEPEIPWTVRVMTSKYTRMGVAEQCPPVRDETQVDYL